MNNTDPDRCLRLRNFVPLFTKEQLYQQFRNDLEDPEILVREYRDLAVLFWCIGADTDMVLSTVDELAAVASELEN